MDTELKLTARQKVALGYLFDAYCRRSAFREVSFRLRRRHHPARYNLLGEDGIGAGTVKALVEMNLIELDGYITNCRFTSQGFKVARALFGNFRQMRELYVKRQQEAAQRAAEEKAEAARQQQASLDRLIAVAQGPLLHSMIAGFEFELIHRDAGKTGTMERVEFDALRVRAPGLEFATPTRIEYTGHLGDETPLVHLYTSSVKYRTDEVVELIQCIELMLYMARRLEKHYREIIEAALQPAQAAGFEAFCDDITQRIPLPGPYMRRRRPGLDEVDFYIVQSSV